VPALAIVDRLDGVDAAGEGFAGEGGRVGAPEMGDVAEGLGLIFDLVLGVDGVTIFCDGCDPVIDGEDVGAVGADGDEASVGEEELLPAGAVLVGGTGDCAVDGGDELVEGVGGWAGGGCLGLGMEGEPMSQHRGHGAPSEGEKDEHSTHGGSVLA